MKKMILLVMAVFTVTLAGCFGGDYIKIPMYDNELSLLETFSVLQETQELEVFLTDTLNGTFNDDNLLVSVSYDRYEYTAEEGDYIAVYDNHYEITDFSVNTTLYRLIFRVEPISYEETDLCFSQYDSMSKGDNERFKFKLNQISEGFHYGIEVVEATDGCGVSSTTVLENSDYLFYTLPIDIELLGDTTPVNPDDVYSALTPDVDVTVIIELYKESYPYSSELQLAPILPSGYFDLIYDSSAMYFIKIIK